MAKEFVIIQFLGSQWVEIIRSELLSGKVDFDEIVRKYKDSDTAWFVLEDEAIIWYPKQGPFKIKVEGE